LFDQEVVVQGRFDGRIVLRNFQLYQLALVLLVLRDLDDGYVQIGSGTTRGNGWVAADVRRIVIESRRGKTDSGKLGGAAAIGSGLGDYQIFGNDEIALPQGIKAETRLVWDQVELSTDQVDDLAECLVEDVWLRFLDQATGIEGWRA
jgi:hypothetical protein